MTGVVRSFDAEVGLGVVRTDDGRDLPFHCTQIADGTRTIAVGTAVHLAVVAGRGGRFEAGGLTPAAAGAVPGRAG